MTVVMKAIALVQAVETQNPNGEFDVILSAPTLDRDGEVIDSKAFDPLPDHIPFDIDHSMTVTGTVGSGVPYYDEKGLLRVKGTFASTPLGQEVRTLVAEGHIRTTSVTFIAAKRKQDEKGVDHVQTAELLNGTFTPVPSNREAVVLSAKALAAVVDEKVGARNSASDNNHLQAAHDHMTAMGAVCAVKSVKAVAGAPEDTTGTPTLASALDAAIDAALSSVDGLDMSAWPAEVVSFYNLVQAADIACDELLDSLGLADPDEDTPAMANTAGSTAAKAAVLPAVKVVNGVPDEVLARMSLVKNAAHLAFS